MPPLWTHCRRVATAALDLIGPPLCAACGRPAPVDGAVLCPGCAGRLERPAPRCPGCGLRTGAFAGGPSCTRCRPGHLGVDSVVAGLSYGGVARELVLALKFRRDPRAARPLAAVLVEALVAAQVPGDLVVPVVLSRARRRVRGYDQAALVAGLVARALRLESAPRALFRHRHTPPQAAQTPARRRRGLRGAFRPGAHPVRGRAVLLVDDVLTSGATVRAAASALRRAGALAVVAAVACRSEPWGRPAGIR